VREKLEHKRYMFVSANVVNHPLLSHVHARLGAVHDPDAVVLEGPVTGLARRMTIEEMDTRWVWLRTRLQDQDLS
jgi:hypothetical protein